MTDTSFAPRAVPSCEPTEMQIDRDPKVIAFPRPNVAPTTYVIDDDDRRTATLLTRIDDAMTATLIKGDVLQDKIAELLSRLDDLGAHIETLDDTPVTRALHNSHQAICRTLLLSSEGLKLQFQVLSDLPTTQRRGADTAADGTPLSGWIRSFASLFGRRLDTGQRC
jgi:hypothetical protein